MKTLRLILLIALLAVAGRAATAATPPIHFVGSEDNDLYRTLRLNRVPTERFDDLDRAIKAAPRRAGLVVAADGYPDHRTAITPAQFARIERKRLRLYLEYPAAVPGLTLPAAPYAGRLERGVVRTADFGKELPPMSILGINDCRILPVEVSDPLVVYAKVAGFDHAQFGLADTKCYPLLFRHRGHLVATTALSGFCRARFGPADSWKTFWQYVIGSLAGDTRFVLDTLPVDPVPACGPAEAITPEKRREAIRRSAEWLWKARLFIHPAWEAEELAKYQPANGDPNLFFGPPITTDMLQGDGSRGVMEGHASNILHDGSQQYRYFVRADVQGETAFLLAAAARVTGRTEYNATAERLLDYLFYTSGFRAGARNCPDSASYGLIGWANTHPGTFFNDDNARCMLGAIGASALMENQRWNRLIAENILGNLRTCSRQGFQGNALDQRDLERNGWAYYNARDYVNPHPHFESWMWACYLWLYDKTGYRPLLEKARTAIRITIEAYPDRWLTQNGMQQERARMILPLAWLVRVDDTPEHRAWLDRMVSALLESQADCGAIREELGSAGSDRNKILVTSNDAYGRNEAPLIARNGDPVADLLYTCNFSFFALNEAAHATGNPRYREAVGRLADFLARIQVRSQAHPDIDGAWFRAFDFGRWDYWASNADNGWGAWCTLTGWIQTWITATEALVERQTSYWQATQGIDMRQAFDACRPMLAPQHQPSK